MGASGRISTGPGDKDDTILGEIAFPVMLEPWWWGKSEQSIYRKPSNTAQILYCVG